MPIGSKSNRVRCNLYIESNIRHILKDLAPSLGYCLDYLWCAPSSVVLCKSSSGGLGRPWWCGPCIAPWVPGVVPPTLTRRTMKVTSMISSSRMLGWWHLNQEALWRIYKFDVSERIFLSLQHLLDIQMVSFHQSKGVRWVLNNLDVERSIITSYFEMNKKLNMPKVSCTGTSRV
jgi:hypothetical protein